MAGIVLPTFGAPEPKTKTPLGSPPYTAPPGYKWQNNDGRWDLVVDKPVAPVAPTGGGPSGSRPPVSVGGGGSGGYVPPVSIPPPAPNPRQIEPGGYADYYEPNEPSMGPREKGQMNEQYEQRVLDRLMAFSKSMGEQGPVKYDPRGDEAAARSAAFSRQKDMAGRNARASLDALFDITASRGLSGSGIEASLAADVAHKGTATIDDFIREQTMSDLSHARDVAGAEYQGNIAQRAQNLGYAQSLLGLISTGHRLY